MHGPRCGHPTASGPLAVTFSRRPIAASRAVPGSAKNKLGFASQLVRAFRAGRLSPSALTIDGMRSAPQYPRCWQIRPSRLQNPNAGIPGRHDQVGGALGATRQRSSLPAAAAWSADVRCRVATFRRRITSPRRMPYVHAWQNEPLHRSGYRCQAGTPSVDPSHRPSPGRSGGDRVLAGG